MKHVMKNTIKPIVNSPICAECGQAVPKVRHVGAIPTGNHCGMCGQPVNQSEAHTPGPWVLSLSPDLIGTLGNGGPIPDGRKLVAQVHGLNRAADAALICAAPDLLSALAAVIDYAESEAYTLAKMKDSPKSELEAKAANEACKAARAALGKARMIF